MGRAAPAPDDHWDCFDPNNVQLDSLVGWDFGTEPIFCGLTLDGTAWLQ
jgi:hypothetical protein